MGWAAYETDNDKQGIPNFFNAVNVNIIVDTSQASPAKEPPLKYTAYRHQSGWVIAWLNKIRQIHNLSLFCSKPAHNAAPEQQQSCLLLLSSNIKCMVLQ